MFKSSFVGIPYLCFGRTLIEPSVSKMAYWISCKEKQPFHVPMSAAGSGPICSFKGVVIDFSFIDDNARPAFEKTSDVLHFLR